MVFLKEFFEKVDFEKNQQTTKSRKITQHAKMYNQKISGVKLVMEFGDL